MDIKPTARAVGYYLSPLRGWDKASIVFVTVMAFSRGKIPSIVSTGKVIRVNLSYDC
jgi:hypothetical protein